MIRGDDWCSDCDAPRAAHRLIWLENAFDAALPAAAPRMMPPAVGYALEEALEHVLRAVRLLRRERSFNPDDLPLRSMLFAHAAQERGVTLTAIRGPWGYTNHLLMQVNGKTFRIEGLPNVARQNGRLAAYADDKWKVKQILRKHGFPFAEGRPFWQWQMNRAVQYGQDTFGFPLVVKPRNGSVARHVTIDVQNEPALRHALRHAFTYSPAVIVERYIPGSVHRLTVVGDAVFCMRQIPAHVTGDGVHTIAELVAEKNARPERNVHAGGHDFFHPITLDAAATDLLSEKGYSHTSILAEDVRVMLARDPFMRHGGDLEELTPQVHPTNQQLARDIAALFGMKLVAMDFICEDIARPWQEQTCAILELNSLPSIETHHFPSYGSPQNVAGAIVDMALRYYR
jgi:D-alanine-D-alanine ligase-like ATP-grasp enzyme